MLYCTVFTSDSYGFLAVYINSHNNHGKIRKKLKAYTVPVTDYL